MERALWSRLGPIVVIALVLVLLVWAAAFRMIGTHDRMLLDEGKLRASELAGFFERDVKRVLNVAEVNLREALRIHRTYGLDMLDAFAADALELGGVVSGFVLLDPRGEVLYSSEAWLEVVAGQFRDMSLDARASGPVVSLPVVEPSTGHLTLGYAHPFRNPDGSFGGVILATLRPQHFVDFYESINLGPNSSATLIGTDDKRIRARSSYGLLGPGQDVSGSRLWSEVAEADAGIYRQTSVVDGITRYYAYRVLPGYPLLVSIGLADSDIIAGTGAYARSAQAIATLTSLVVLVLSAMLCREVVLRHRVMQEVAVRKTAETELARANTDLLQYAHSASHDLKAPLASIAGLMDICLEDLDHGDLAEVRSNIAEAGRISERSARKVENLLNIAKSGLTERQTEHFSLRRLVREIWEDQTASQPRIARLDLDLGDLDGITGERSSIQLILENLISNAIRYREESRDICIVRVSAARHKGGLTLSVTDNGIGIRADHKERVFESFVRLDARGGDGLGLALVAKHVSRLAGEIRLDSTPGVGTTFTLNLPEPETRTHEDTGRGHRRQRGGPLYPEASAGAR